MKNKYETRSFTFKLEESDDRPSTLVGYAAVFNSESRDLGGFTEVVLPGAFTRSIEKGDDIKALFNHDYAHVIGRQKNNTLKMVEDEVGLRVEITPPNTTAGRDLLEQVRAGYIDSMSFGFTVNSQEWDFSDNKRVRKLKDVTLFEVSVVSEPAYQDTSLAVRSMEEALKEEVEADAPTQDPNLFKLKFKLAKHKSVD